MTKLHIGDGFSLPLEFTTQTQAILAIKRVGKSYTASVQAEELLKAGQQIVAIDVTGAWWGLRSNAEGNGPGFPILIAGGDHGDIPLEEGAGEVLAEAIVSERFSAIIDVSLFRKAQAQRFLAVFFETLYRKNREAMHLFMDEADFYAPQKPFGEEARTLGAVNDIVRRGGIRGIGSTLITQRPSVLNKDVLTQCGILTCLRIIHPRDMAAIREWVNVHSDPKLAKEMETSLPSLPKGSAWVWAPGWPDDDGIFKLIHVRKRETFDSGATPKAGQVAKAPKVIAQVDIAKLGAQISETAQRVKDNDPKELKKKIADLERQLRSAPSVTKEITVIDVQAIKIAVDKAIAQRDREHNQQLSAHQAIIEKMQNAFASIGKITGQYMSIELPKEKHAPIEIEVPRTARPVTRQPRPVPQPAKKTAAPAGDGSLSGTARKMLGVLAWYPDGASRSFVAHMVGMKPTTGTFRNYLSELRTNEFMSDNGSLMKITDAGLSYLGDDIPAPPQTTDEVMDLWQSRLSGTAYKMLAHLVERSGKPVSRDDLGDAVGISSSTGTFRNYMSELRTAGLISEPDKQSVGANRETLFL